MALIEMIGLEEEMKKNKELKESDLEMLMDWVNKQPHLPQMTYSELVIFLHSNYYRTEPTKSTIDTFFTIRTHVPEFFSNRDPLGCKELRQSMQVVCNIPLPGTTPDGNKIILAKFIDSDSSRFVFTDWLRLLAMALELWIYTTGTIQGHIVVLDMDGMTFGHLARLNPISIKKFLYYLQDALPVRLKGLHFINAVPFVDVIFNMMKPCMKRELMDVFSIHNNKESLNKVFPIDLLPNDQGGKAGPLKDLWDAEIQKMEKHRAWFQAEEIRKANESLRPGEAKNATDVFGVEGSFKKLDID